MNPLNLLKDFFFPRLCAACTKTLESYENQLCVDCLLHLPQILDNLHEERAIASKFWGKLKVKNTYSFLQFTKNGPVQHILHQLKYRNKPELAEFLGQWFGQELKARNFAADIDVLVGIPLHAYKQRLRGYNQADCFAKGLAEALQTPFVTDALIRTQFTETQTKKSRYARYENIKGVFQVRDAALFEGKHVGLVDDVLTTGSTLEAAGAELLGTGCTALTILTIAAAQ
ncbi:ComF family protein [Marinilongibacter aquaticus]|uniref:ComF family protein n=1 Tax=Marinilongibacter aquaticus TaxID=2975157 RepID=UPI0021BD163E|nr:phosphoribosyltransferase family protein [Marinilongibacter aquaticus]UBM57495.1 ComF family protein [Marinilongibacter aquaticus]